MRFIISVRRLVSLGLNRFPTSLRGWLPRFHPPAVDAGQAQQEGVRTFLKQLTDRSRGGSGVLDIMEKDIPYASMHKKILVTPIGGLMGSANLSSPVRHEVRKSMPARARVELPDVEASCDDSFTHANSWSE